MIFIFSEFCDNSAYSVENWPKSFRGRFIRFSPTLFSATRINALNFRKYKASTVSPPISNLVFLRPPYFFLSTVSRACLENICRIFCSARNFIFCGQKEYAIHTFEFAKADILYDYKGYASD